VKAESRLLDRGRALLGFAALLSSPAPAFDYFEHRYLGNSAYRKALDEIGDPGFEQALESAAREKLGFGRTVEKPSDAAERLLNQLPLRFGDLSALAGDFTADDADLKDLIGDMLKRAWVTAPALVVDTRRQWFNACKWLYRSRGEPPAVGPWEDCFRSIAGDGDAEGAPRSEFAARGYEASREELAAHEMISNYISLASQNRSHFPRHSWKSYSDYHEKALRLASCYGRKVACPGPGGRPLSGDELLVAALLAEAFAQHYLHDSFASGHIGTRYGDCTLWVFCKPTKRTVKQTHDVLNELGLEVVIASPPSHLGDAAGKVREGWSAFGDDHLFVREADFHRNVVVRTAAASLKEVLERARSGEEGPCRMCDSRIFPVPKNEAFVSEESRAAFAATDLGAANYPAGDLADFEKACSFWGSGCLDERSRDPRIPAVPVEGWKIGFGHARQSLGGNLRTGPLEQGAMLRLDYLRNGDPRWPNTYGFEFWGMPNFRSSYLLTAGWSWPREQSPLSIAVRFKYGWRIEDAFTRDNPDPQRVGGVEITFPSVELTYDLYPPVALFLTVNAVTVFFKNGSPVTELINHNEFSLALGLRFDLSGI
jgi:hypothetical protein